MPKTRSDTAQELIIKAIRATGENIYTNYDLYKVTEKIEYLVPDERVRRIKKIDKTSQIIKIIEHIKTNKLI